MAETQNNPLTYRLVDEIPEAAEQRLAVRLEALNILERRRQQLPGNSETVAELPLPIDALSTAHSVLEAKNLYGQDSPEHAELLQGLQLDCSRLVAEWYRKKKPEYFPPSRHKFDQQTEQFYSHGLSVRQMTENALRPISEDPEEENRRVNERVEDATPQILRKLGSLALNGLALRTISECTDKAIHDFHQDQHLGRPHQGYGGYVPEIEKVMIRDIRLEADTADRFEEQIGLPGRYINHYVIQKALEHRGANVGHMDKTELHGSQILVDDDLLDFVKLLDDVASEQWCVDIFMGEKLEAGQIKNYAGFRQAALERQSGLKDLVLTVTNFVLSLAENNVDRHKAPALVEEFVKKLLLDLGKQDYVIAEQMFDKDTAEGLQKVAYLESIGQYEQAFTMQQQIEKAAPGGGYCSGGSCGLESVNTYSKEGQDLAEKLKANPSDHIVRDTERKCNKCNKRGIVYAFNESKVNKYCTNCQAFESKVSKTKV